MSFEQPGRACPVAIGKPKAALVEKVLKRHRAQEEKIQRERHRNVCYLLGRALSPTRVLNTKWCLCGSCVVFTTTHDNVCCRELVEEGGGVGWSRQRREIAQRLSERFTNVAGQCLVQHPSFHKVVLDSEVLSVWVETRRYEKSKEKLAITNEDVNRSFVTWAYGHLGLGNRYEIPSCVRAAIMDSYPSRDGQYVGFRQSRGREARLECDDEEWREGNF